MERYAIRGKAASTAVNIADVVVVVVFPSLHNDTKLTLYVMDPVDCNCKKFYV